MPTIWIATGVIGFIGVLLALGGIGGVSRRKPVSGGGRLAVGGGLAGVASIFGLVGFNLNTYNRLTYEQYVAQLEFEQIEPQLFEATVRTPDGAETTYELRGDDWQLDARVLKFPPWANVAGLDAVYRLDRLSGRYESIQSEVTADRTVYAMSENPGIDVWSFARGRGQALKIDTSFGSAVYHPMADGAEFEVSMTQSSLVSRPNNDAARRAVTRWDGSNPPPPLPEDESGR